MDRRSAKTELNLLAIYVSVGWFITVYLALKTSAGADCNNNKHCGIVSKVLGFYLAQLFLNSIHMLSYTHVKYSNNKLILR